MGGTLYSSTGQAIDRYVHDLASALRGPRRVRAEMITEARHSLLDAMAAFVEGGLEPHDAERRAVEEFGSHAQVVPAYQAELASAQGKRTALWIALVLPLINVLEPLMWWDGPWSLANSRISHIYWLLVDHFKYTSFLAAATAGLVVLGFGWGSRFLGDGVRFTRLVGRGFLAFLALHGLVGTLVFVLSIYQWPSAATWPPVLVGMTVNTAAFGYAAFLAGRCLSVTRRLARPAG